MLALWAVLFLGERPSPGGVLGIATILCGLVVLGGAPLWSRLAGIRTPTGHGWRNCAPTRGSGSAFLVAFFISVYSTLDGAAVRQWDPMPYLVLVFGLSRLAFVGMLATRGGKRVFRVLRTHFRPSR